MGNGSMLDELNERIEELKNRVVEHETKSRRIRDLESDLQLYGERIVELASILKSEEDDVDQLEGNSIRGMYLSLLGDNEKVLAEEKREYFAAWLKHDQAVETAKQTRTEIASLRARGLKLGDLRSRQVALFREKERFLIEADDHYSEQLLALAEERGVFLAERNELDEAIREGFILQEGLDGVIRELRQAQGWGVFDLLGGGLIATAVKHSNLDDARVKIAGVQLQLNRFKREMADVDVKTNLEIEIGRFTTFADFFFDGLMFDWIVQSQISKSLSTVEQTQRAVSDCLNQLSLRQEKNKARDIAIVHDRRNVINRA